jgi:hypothetical protein
MRTIRIDPKTVLLIPDSKEPEETKQKFLEKLNESREKRMRSRVPYLAE